MSEHRGPQGEQGERGPGLTRAARRALVYLFTVAAVLAAAALFWTARQSGATAAQYHREQAAQQRAGEQLELKLCTTFGRLAALKPPPGNPAANPSRAYLQGEHATLVQLGADLGCTKEQR